MFGFCVVNYLYELSFSSRTLANGEFYQAVFADIEGAFNKARFSELSRALCRMGVPFMYSRRIQSMLRGRTVIAGIRSIERCREVQAGCPQGGILSHVLWNCLVDELLCDL